MSNTFQFTGQGNLSAHSDINVSRGEKYNWEKLERLSLGVLDDPSRYQVFDPICLKPSTLHWH